MTERIRGRTGFRERAVAAGLVVLTCSLLAAVSAHADAILSSRTQLCPDSDLSNCVVTTSSDPAGTSDDLQLSTGDSTFDGSASASADYGILRASASLSLTDYAAGTYEPIPDGDIPIASLGIASFTDTWEIFGVPGAGGTLHLTFLAEGTISQSGFGSAVGSVALQNFAFQRLLTSGSHEEVFELPFTSGSPFDIDVALLAYNYVADATAPAIYDFAGNVNFDHTFTLTEILIIDLNGNPIRGAGIRAESDTTYPVSPDNNLGVIPEPATVLLLGSGLLGALGVRCRRRSASSTTTRILRVRNGANHW